MFLLTSIVSLVVELYPILFVISQSNSIRISTSKNLGILNKVENATTGSKYETIALFQGLTPMHWLWYSTGLQTARYLSNAKRKVQSN